MAMEQIGLAAVLDMKDFNANMAKYDAALGDMDKTTSDAAGKIGQHFAGIGTIVGNLALAVGGAFLGIGAAIGATAASGLREFASFEKGMNEVFTLLPGITKEAMDKMTNDIQAFNKEFGVLSEQSVPALYQALSAGVPPDNVFDFLETAQRAALAGVSTLEDTVNGLTSVINAYGSDVIDVGQASDLMFTAVRLGKTTFDELNSSLFNVVPVAAGLGIEFGEVTAALAGMTSQGVPTSVATTQLRQLFVELSKSGSDVSEVFTELTGTNFRDFIAGGGDVQGALKILEQRAQDTGVGINDLFGSVEAGGAALVLTGKGTETFSSNLEAMSRSSGATQTAFETMDQGVQRSIDKIKASFQAMMQDVGEKLAPVFERLAEWVQNNMPAIEETVVGVFSSIADWAMDKLPAALDGLQRAFNYVRDVLIPLAKEHFAAFIAKMEEVRDVLIPLAKEWLAGVIEKAQNLWDMIEPMVVTIGGWIQAFSDMESGQRDLILTLAAVILAVGPVVTAISGLATVIGGIITVGGGAVTALTGAGGVVASLLGLLTPIGWVVTAVGALGLAWFALSKDTEDSAVAMRESAEREAQQMATVTGETFKGWADSVAAYHRQMKDESGLTLNEMIDNINADFWQMRQDVEASSGEMSESAIAEMEKMRLGAIQQASEMNTGVSGEVDEMAATTGAASAEFSQTILSDAVATRQGAVGDMEEMNISITDELTRLEVAATGSSAAMKTGILAELNSLRVQHADGTTTWKDGTLEKIRGMTDAAIQDAGRMKTGVTTAVQYMKDGAILSVEQMANGIKEDARGMELSATESARLLRIGMEGQLLELKNNSANLSAGQKDLILRNLDSMTVQYADGSIGWKNEAIETAGGLKTGVIAAAGGMKTGVIYSLDEMKKMSGDKFGAMATDSKLAASQQATDVKEEYVTMRGLVADELETMKTDNKTDGEAAGKSVADGVKEGVQSNKTGPLSALSTLATDMWNEFKRVLGIHSPSTVFAEAGYDIAAGLAQGISEGQGLVSSAMDDLYGQTELALNQYRAMVDGQLAATIQRYQQGLAQGQAQDAIRQGFNQEQYAAYWAAKQAGESEEQAIAKGQQVTGGGTPAAGSGGAAATPAAPTPPVWSAGGGSALPAQYQGLQEQIWEQAYGFLRDIGWSREDLADQVSYTAEAPTLFEDLREALKDVRGLMVGELSSSEVVSAVPNLIEELEAFKQINVAGTTRAALSVDLRLKINELIATLSETGERASESIKSTIATSSLGALLGKFGGQRQLSQSEIDARKVVARADIDPQLIAVNATIQNISAQMQELDNMYDAQRNMLLSQQLSQEEVTAALNQWLQATGNQQRGISLFSDLRNAQGQRNTLDALLAERMAQIEKESVVMPTPDTSSITTILQGFAASTLGTKVTDFMADLEYKFSNLYGGISQRLGNAEYFGIDTGGLEQNAIVEAAKTLFSAGGETIFSTIDSALSTLLNYRSVAAAASLENTGNRTDGGWSAPELTSAISDIASALRQMQSGTTFNVAFQGSAGANADVMSDIQFLNSLYAT